MNEFQPSEPLLEFLRHWESGPNGAGEPALEAYEDSGGVPTIAWGHTADVQMGDTCTLDEADAWLRDDAAWFMDRVCPLFTVPVTQKEADGCCALAYNIGMGGPGKPGFSNSQVLANVNGGQFHDAEIAFSNWRFVTIQGRKVEVRGLVRRRLAERAIFANGFYENYP